MIPCQDFAHITQALDHSAAVYDNDGKLTLHYGEEGSSELIARIYAMTRDSGQWRDMKKQACYHMLRKLEARVARAEKDHGCHCHSTHSEQIRELLALKFQLKPRTPRKRCC
ncbi:MAG: hypothetical protein KGJ02_05765 [Verrucomicrobiota bacterium]|nr:hypothetical protein [Verrucomicrobiota bacterium]